ncbi:MAG: hypothetical protein IRZ16_00725 [Myxococcaceae bacterium]|nr:hypothetical protein [Myxococcaceae bacterium]
MSVSAIAEKLKEVPPGTFRHTVLSAARRFKSSWVELGRLLKQVLDEGSYREWGYDTFEQYCAKELHIRKATADKLLRSFGFLHRHEPAAVANDNIVELAPAFEVVEVLAGAEERGQLSAEEYRNIREAIWNPDKPTSELRREIAQRFPRPPPEPPADAVVVRRLALAARKLAADLKACRKMPPAIVERALALAEDVEEVASQLDNR